MSLPAKLRDRIYYFALTPDEDGEGGVPGSRAICLGRHRDLEGSGGGSWLRWWRVPH